MVHIIDAVLGDISPTKAELSLIDDPHMQRLHQIRQLHFAYLVYPGANHTRFEHSLGTMSITREIVANALGKRNEELECAALLHDIGHAAFSHASDIAMAKYLKTSHEKIGGKIISSSSIRDRINDSTLSYKKIISYFKGNGEGAIVTGTLGSDRLDYLSRDSHYTGVGYGVVDYSNLRNKITLFKGKPAIYESAARNAEYMLLARYFMFTSVYYHHAVMIAQAMYENALSAAIDSGKMPARELSWLNDSEMMTRLSGIKESGELAWRLAQRRLYKRAFDGLVKKNVDMAALCGNIERTGLGATDYVCRMVRFKGGDDDIAVVDRNGDKVGMITDVSPLVGALMKVLKGEERLLVACDQRHVASVRKIVEKFAGA